MALLTTEPPTLSLFLCEGLSNTICCPVFSFSDSNRRKEEWCWQRNRCEEKQRQWMRVKNKPHHSSLIDNIKSYLIFLRFHINSMNICDPEGPKSKYNLKCSDIKASSFQTFYLKLIFQTLLSQVAKVAPGNKYNSLDITGLNEAISNVLLKEGALDYKRKIQQLLILTDSRESSEML